MSMKHITVFLSIHILLAINLELWASRQVRDNLTYNNVKVSIRDFPLEQLYQNNKNRPDFFENEKFNKFPASTGCNRGYQADWIIIDKQLYLIQIKSCAEGDNLKTANLKKLFEDKYLNEKVKADWFTGKIIAEIGEPILYLNFAEYIFPYEQQFDFEQGNLVGVKYFDNTKSKESAYFSDFEMFEDYVYSRIDWASLPKLDNKEIIVKVRFCANKNGIIDSAFVDSPKHLLFDNEAIRVIKSIPEWNIYLREGKVLLKEYNREIVFSDKMKMKYYKPLNDCK